MKRLFILIAVFALSFSACNTGSGDTGNDTTVTDSLDEATKMTIDEIDASSDKIADDAEALENEADSILNNL